MTFRLTVFALAAFGFVLGRAADGVAGCAPGCKICLLDVCSDAPQRGTGARDLPPPPRSRTAPSAPISDDPLVNRENELKGLKPSDITPVDEWTGEKVGFSKRDFVLSFLFDFVMIGNCQTASCASKQIASIQAKLRRSDISDEDRDRLRKREAEERKEMQEAQGSIQKFKYDCRPVKSYCFVD